MIARYLFSVAACALAVSLACSVPQKKSIGRIVTLLGGMIVLLALLRPLMQHRFGNLESYLKRYAPDDSMISSALEEGQNESGRLISEQTCEYILDKARSVGARVEVQIELAALSDYYRYPYRATLRGDWTPEQKAAISAYISDTLGIPEERQIWIKSD